MPKIKYNNQFVEILNFSQNELTLFVYVKVNNLDSAVKHIC